MGTQSSQEEEAIRVLQFQSEQRLWALEQEAVRTAMQGKLRDEVWTGKVWIISSFV